MHKIENPEGKMKQNTAFTYNFPQVIPIGKKPTDTYTKAFSWQVYHFQSNNLFWPQCTTTFYNLSMKTSTVKTQRLLSDKLYPCFRNKETETQGSSDPSQ